MAGKNFGAAPMKLICYSIIAWFWPQVLLAVDPGVMDPGIATLVGNVGVVGVLIWYLWFSTTKTLPRLTKTFTDESTLQRNAFASAIEAMRMTFSQEQAAMRQQFGIEQSGMRQSHEREMSDYKKMLLDNMDAFRRAVHDVKNTADLAVKKRDLSSLEKEPA